MNTEVGQTSFLISSRDASELEWLGASLLGMGEVIKVGETLEEIIKLAELMSAALVFVGIDRRNQVQQCTLIESLIEAKPMLGVVAVGDGYDSELVIAAMRAGARDFITYGLRSSEVQGLVRRLITRLPQLPDRPQRATVTLFYGAQPDADAALVATHVALALAEAGASTLLIDLGIPLGESKAATGLDCTFHFDDALRNLRRLDGTVIESAFARHQSGLTLLPLLDENAGLEACTSAELFLLMGNFRQHFDHLVVNACGQRDSDLIRTLAGSAAHLFWMVDQSVPCSRRNLERLQLWRSSGAKLDHAQLLVDRYLEKHAPDAATLARSFDLPLAAALPFSPAVRLECRNQGRPIYEFAPRDALSRALRKLVRELSAVADKPQGIVRRILELGR